MCSSTLREPSPAVLERRYLNRQEVLRRALYLNAILLTILLAFTALYAATRDNVRNYDIPGAAYNDTANDTSSGVVWRPYFYPPSTAETLAANTRRLTVTASLAGAAFVIEVALAVAYFVCKRLAFKAGIKHLEATFAERKAAVERALLRHRFDPASDVDPRCVICLRDFSKGSLIKKTVCNHLFHKKCATKWLRDESACPTCKRELLYGDAADEAQPRVPEGDARSESSYFSDDNVSTVADNAAAPSARSGATLSATSESGSPPAPRAGAPPRSPRAEVRDRARSKSPDASARSCDSDVPRRSRARKASAGDSARTTRDTKLPSITSD